MQTFSTFRRTPAPALVALVALLPLSACGPSEPPAPTGPSVPVAYPPSERVEQVDTYHGVEVADPYRWLEELDGEATAAWVEAQNAVADPFLEAIPAREAIRERLTELWNYERYRLPVKEGGRYFWRRNDGLQDQDVLWVADSLDAEPRVLVDPNTFSDDRTASLYTYVPSPDGRWLAYAISEGGSDWRTWHIRDVESGEDLPESLAGIKFSEASWTPDGAGFYYSRYPPGEEGLPDDSKQVSVFHHVVGTPQSADTRSSPSPTTTGATPTPRSPTTAATWSWGSSRATRPTGSTTWISTGPAPRRSGCSTSGTRSTTFSATTARPSISRPIATRRTTASSRSTSSAPAPRAGPRSSPRPRKCWRTSRSWAGTSSPAI